MQTIAVRPSSRPTDCMHSALFINTKSNKASVIFTKRPSAHNNVKSEVRLCQLMCIYVPASWVQWTRGIL